jgi:hypothetical protein
MSIKEIRELDEEVKEVSVDEGEDLVEKDTKERGEEVEEEKFSIGDTMLARGESVESWGAKNLEDTLSDEDLNEDFESEDFESEEEEDGFSYETAEREDSGDLYGGGDASVGDLYGATRSNDSVSMYNTGGGSASESSLYNVASDGKKNMMGVEYKVEGPKKKKKAVRRGPKSGLESGTRKKHRSKGVSLF